jgi:hypothetical protein
VTTNEPGPRRPAQTLGTILGLRKSAQSMSHEAVTVLHHQSKMTDRFHGLVREYTPDAITDDGPPETLPGETKIVELKAEQLIDDMAGAMSRFWDLQLTMDVADTNAFADIRVSDRGGSETVLVEHVPVTTLMVLGKRLEDVRTFIKTLPVLNPSYTWTRDNIDTYVWMTAPVETVRNKRTKRHTSIAAATKEHKEQVLVWDDDVRAGVWTKIERSGALSPRRYGQLLQRVDELIAAVEVAREEANRVLAPDHEIADALFSYIISER